MASQGQHIEQHLGQHLQQRLTPLQVRFVRMLEMNRSEADEAVEKELADNPALEQIDDSLPETPTEHGDRFRESSEDLQRKDYADPDEIPWYRLRTPDSGRTDIYIPVTPDDGDDLYSSLLTQLSELHLSPEVRDTAEYIIDSLDANGYLTRSPAGMLSDIIIATGREVSPQTMTQALEAVRSLDPAGVGALSLEQCMELQLLRLPQSTAREDALEIVRRCWDSFLKRHSHKITSRLRISSERTAAAVALIARLNPKPGGAVGNERGSRAAAIVPDFIVDTDDDGSLTVSLGGRNPRLAIEASFESAMKLMQSRENRKPKGADYITARYNDARDFIALVRQRRETLLAVITAIAKIQKEYFLTGDESTLRPMTLKDVAAIIGNDPSTVSRSTSGKYVQTRAGIKPMRFFFSEGYSVDDGADVSARQVQAALKKIVEQEDSSHPLSDEALCTRLSEQGFDVSRRTVAKYRDRLGIPVARLRKTH